MAKSTVFEDLTVLDFSSNLAGPGAASMLADLGANVIKIERPITGDDTRSIYPLIDGISIQYMWLNRGKKSVVLSLKDPEAQAMVRKMAETADVIIESYRPGQMKKFGLDYEAIRTCNESIIYCSVSACGQEGPYAGEPGFDLIAQGMSGLMDMAGEVDGPPTKMGTTVGDYIGTFNAFGAICAALYHRLRTGEGQYIDISLLAGLVACNTSVDIAATFDTHPTRIGPHDFTVVPYGTFRGRNGESAVIVACTHKLWPKMCRLIGREEWAEEPSFKDPTARVEHRPEIIEAIEAYLRGFADMDAAVADMKAAGIPCTKIKTTHEVANDAALWETGSLTELETTASLGGKQFKGRGPWIKLSKTPFTFHAPSDLGAYNHEVLERYGWSREKVEELEAKWAGQ